MSEEALTNFADLIGEAPPAPSDTPSLKQLLKRDGITKAEHAALVEERKAIREKGGRPPAVQPVRDLLVQQGYESIVRLFPKLAARLEKALDNEKDPLHERAVDILSKRGLPIAFFEGLAKQEFREDGEGANAGPRISIHIHTASVPDMAPAIDVPFKEKAE